MPKPNEKPADYFEGVLQLRSVSDEAVDWLYDEIQRTGRTKIAKVKEVPGGIDLYLSAQHYMQTLGRQLQHRFGGILKITSRLFTRSSLTSRDIHRMTVLFRQLPCKTGDVISYHGEEWKVLAMGNQIQLQNVKSGERIRVSADKLSEHIAK
jgi:NMD protein affecting ribosome stability and mRNA decay